MTFHNATSSDISVNFFDELDSFEKLVVIVSPDVNTGADVTDGQLTGTWMFTCCDDTVFR